MDTVAADNTRGHKALWQLCFSVYGTHASYPHTQLLKRICLCPGTHVSGSEQAHGNPVDKLIHEFPIKGINLYCYLEVFVVLI